MKSKLPIYIILFSALAFNGYAQKEVLAKADKKYERFAYIDAIKTYERVAEKGYKSADMFLKLANACYFNAELEKAARWYGELFAMTQDVEPECYYRYSQSLKSIGQYDKADQMLAIFNQKSGNDSRGALFNQNRNYLEEIKANSWRYKINDAGVNSTYSDYGSSFSGNRLVFTSSRDTGNFSKKKDKWTGHYFTNMYSSEMNDTIAGPVNKFAEKINTKFHESTPIFTKDGKTMYFTRNNYNNGKKGLDADRTTLLKIYKSELVDNQWSKPVELPFNSDQYSVAHPALSPDNKTLYFASNMPGSIGQSDLFKTSINEDGSYGVPENLGAGINTEGRETFPFISDDNELFFATDGRPGLGGLDIFMVKITRKGTFKEVQNIGEPGNSPKDDFGYWYNTKTRRGFLTSNRDGGKGFDDIYKFLETRKITCEQALSGIVTDLETGIVLPNSKVTLFDHNFNLIKQVMSNEVGYYNFIENEDEDPFVECDKFYYIRGEKEEYNTKEQKFNTSKERGRTDVPIALEKTACQVAIGDDLGYCFGIKMIYFDLNKSIVRYEAAFELEKILDVMKKHPKMKIDVRSHTDSRGSFKYNEALSDRRAKATIKWLIDNGISPSRLSAKGYGENELVNKCADKVECTEEEHQENRRSQFIIKAL